MTVAYGTLRTNLLTLFAWFGGLVLVVLVWNLGTAVNDHLGLRFDMARGAETDALIRLEYDLRREDMAIYEALMGEPGLLGPEEAARRSDAALVRAGQLLAAHAEGGHQVAVTFLRTLGGALVARRAGVMAARGASDKARWEALQPWRGFMDVTYPRLETISHDLITETGTPGARGAQITALRYYALFALRAQIANRFALERAMIEGQADHLQLVRLSQASAALRGAANLAEDQILTDPAPAFRAVAQATRFMLEDYLPAEMGVLQGMMQSGRPAPKALVTWREASRQAVRLLGEAETALSGEAEARRQAAWRRGMAGMALWLGALTMAAGLLAVAIRFTLHRIVTPLERVHAKMLRLAHDDLTVELRTRPRLAEIQAMYDALAVFKENALRRERMQAELGRLNDRVVAANQAMTAELEAAARVQAAQLPKPCDLPGARFHSFYRPSSMIAGDTYDYVTLPNGRTRLFQIDVSGHGAAAALVSVMSHIAVKTALEKAGPAVALAEVVARVNRDWNDSLPYFTLLLVEIDPRAGVARVVQAGHPPLLRLPPVGGVETVGDGGMPVGALPWAEFEEVTCAFHPGDRLILSTDGVIEASDQDGAMFGDDRYRGLMARLGRTDAATLFAGVDAALWDWCGTESFEDDVTILMLEAKEPTYAH